MIDEIGYPMHRSITITKTFNQQIEPDRVSDCIKCRRRILKHQSAMQRHHCSQIIRYKSSCSTSCHHTALFVAAGGCTISTPFFVDLQQSRLVANPTNGVIELFNNNDCMLQLPHLLLYSHVLLSEMTI
jgi:hypothetical protein